MSRQNLQTRAIVAYPPKDASSSAIWKLETLQIGEPAVDEVLVEVVAVGICHSDITIANRLKPGDPLKVFGHEGAGRVIRSGSGELAQRFRPGDPVLCSFISCEECRNCRVGHPAYCKDSTKVNILVVQDVYTLRDDFGSERRVKGMFFGQSSFANLAIVKAKGALLATPLLKDPRSNDELKLFAPLGCGLMTGSGAVVNVGRVGEGDEVVVMGVGGVGLGGMMAAKVKGAKTIIAVDKVESRLELAKSLGATHTINTSDIQDLAMELPARIKELTEGKEGATCVLDTTGVMPIIAAALQSLATRGHLLLVGVPTFVGGPKLEIDQTVNLSKGASVSSVRLGDADPAKFIPEMVEWYRKGLFPIEKFSKFYDAEEMQKAFDDMLNGTTVKPILVWKESEEDPKAARWQGEKL